MGGFFKEFLMKKYPSFNNNSHGEFYNGFNSSSAAYFAAAAAAAPFASRPLLGIGGRVAYCDAGVTPPTEDYLSSLKTASETVSRHDDTLKYMTKEYSVDMKPLFSAFQPRSFAMTTVRSFLLFYLPLMAPKQDDDNDFDEHPVDWMVPFKNSVTQIFRETSTTTIRRVLERFAVHHCSQRVACKLLKDIPKSCIRKANRGLPFHTYFFCVSRTTFRGQLLGVAASWLVQVGFECFRYVCDISKSNDELENVADHSERAKVLGKKVYGVTVRCGSALIFASIGAGIGATIFRPSSGQIFGCLVGDVAGPIIVSGWLAPPLEH
uniref:uncharacterized protein LOC122598796 n=1 Tax=Erigeron canadensis TaxID=72917 RepID=UPI001CB8F2B1|nr:uncharacterized protein LOC122598796 [Erigeron canadensis]